MNRRGFLGTIIGAVAAVKITSSAPVVTHKPQLVPKSDAPVFPRTKVFSSTTYCGTMSTVIYVPHYCGSDYIVRWREEDEDL